MAKFPPRNPSAGQTRPHRSVGIHEREDHIHARPLLEVVEQLADVLARKRSRARRNGDGGGPADRRFGRGRVRQRGQGRQRRRNADGSRRLQRFTTGHGLVDHDGILVNCVSNPMDRRHRFARHYRERHRITRLLAFREHRPLYPRHGFILRKQIHFSLKRTLKTPSRWVRFAKTYRGALPL